MEAITAWFVLLFGGLLVLPLLGITQIGTATSGIIGWVIALSLLFLGTYHLIIDYSK